MLEDPKRHDFLVPEKHFLKWLETQYHIEEHKICIEKLKIWIGFATYGLSIIVSATLIAFVAIKAPDTLKHLLAFLSAVGSAAGITVGVRKYINRNKREED